MKRISDNLRWFVIGTGLLIAVGSVLPWASLGMLTVAGTDGDGVITLAMGVVIALIGIVGKASKPAGIAVTILGTLSLLIVWNVIGNFNADPSLSEETILGAPSLGTGVYLVLIAAFVAIIAGGKVFGEAPSKEVLTASVE